MNRFHVKMKSLSLLLYPARDAVNYIWHARTFVRWEQASDQAARLNKSVNHCTLAVCTTPRYGSPPHNFAIVWDVTSYFGRQAVHVFF
jgi:hypothetical protein